MEQITLGGQKRGVDYTELLNARAEARAELEKIDEGVR